jgi:hypothetical protein
VIMQLLSSVVSVYEIPYHVMILVAELCNKFGILKTIGLYVASPLCLSWT